MSQFVSFVFWDGAHTLTGAFGGLCGGQGDSAQAEQFEEGGGLLVELTQLSFCPRQVYTAERENKSGGSAPSSGGHLRCLSAMHQWSTTRRHVNHVGSADLNSGLTPRSFCCSSCRLLLVLLKAASC